MVKTVTLNGSEIKVSELEGQNVIIQNLGTSAIYASINPNIAPDADNVIEIPAGGGVNVYGANGTIYLMGTGRAQCTGTDYSTVNFKMPSSSASGGGGDTPAPSAETMPVMDGIGGYYVPETIDLGSGNWNSAVSGKPIKFAENKQLLSSKTVLTSSYGLLEFPDPFRVLYMAAKIRDPNEIMSNASVYLVTEISDTASGNNFAVKLNPLGSHDLVVFSEGGSPSYNTDHSGNNMTVLCVTRDNDNNVSVYVNGENQGDVGIIGSSGYVGKLCVNGYCDTELNFSERNTYLTEWSCFAVGTEIHTAEQIAQNSAWLMSKYGIGGD